MVYRRSSATCERAQQARAQVLHAARAVVAAEGFTGLSMNAVAAEANMAVGSLYRHFPSKTDLVTELLERTCQHELEVLRRIAAAPEPAPGRLADAVGVFARRALSSGGVAYAMICEPTVAEAETRRRRIRAEMAAILAGIVAGGVAEGSFPAQDAALTGAALVGAVSEVLTATPVPGAAPAGVAVDNVVETLVTLALRAAGAERSS